MSAPSVIMITGNYPPVVCGIGDYAIFLTGEMRRQGVPVTIWTRAQSGVVESDTIKTPIKKFDAAGLATVLRRLEAEKPSIIHLQYEADIFDNSDQLGKFVGTARRIGASLVTTFHALDGPKSWGKAHRLPLLPLMVGSDSIVVCSKKQYDGLSKLPIIGAKTHLIPAGSTVPRTGIRKPVAPGTPLRLLYFGFVWRGRNIETCVKALAAVNEAIPPPGATLTIAGGIRDDAYRKEIEDLAASLNVADKITFTGDLSVPDVSQQMIDSDLILLPFATGVSTGRSTFITAVDHHLPILTMATDANLIPEFQNNENLIYVDTEDHEGFIRETVRLAKDKALREKLAANTVALAEFFAWPETARKMIALPAYRKAAAR